MTTDWFQVSIVRDGPLHKQHMLHPHLHYWAMRRDSGTYDVFYASQHGPYVTSLTEADMKAGAVAIRGPHGRLRTAMPDELAKIQYNLNWFLSK